MADTLQIVIEGRDAASSALSGVSRNIENLGSSARSSGGHISSLGSTLRTAVGTAIGFATATIALQGFQAAAGLARGAIFGMNASLETSTLQFETLMGDADLARDHVAMLFEFAKKTPFETEPIIKASRALQTFGGTALNSAENLTLVGDAAAAVSAPMDEVAFWVGRAYAAIQAGRPFGESAARLQEMAIMSPKARDEMEKLQKAGASADEVWKIFEGDLGKFTGAMEKQAGTWGGLTSTFSDTLNIVAAKALRPFFELAKSGLEGINTLLGGDGVSGAAEDFANAVRDGFGRAGAAVVTLSRTFSGLFELFSDDLDDTTEGFAALHEEWGGMFGADMAERILAVSQGIRAIMKALTEGDTGELRELLESVFGPGSEVTENVVGLARGFYALEKNVEAAAKALKENFNPATAEGQKNIKELSETMAAGQAAIEAWFKLQTNLAGALKDVVAALLSFAAPMDSAKKSGDEMGLTMGSVREALRNVAKALDDAGTAAGNFARWVRETKDKVNLDINAVMRVFMALGSTIGTIVGGINSALGGMARAFLALARGDFKEASRETEKAVDAIAQASKDAARDWDRSLADMRADFANLKGVVTADQMVVEATLSESMARLAADFDTAGDDMHDGVVGAVNAIDDDTDMGAIYNDVVGGMWATQGGAQEAAENTYTAVTGNVNAISGGLDMGAIYNTIVGGLWNVVPSAGEAAGYIAGAVSDYINSIPNSVGWVFDTVRGWVQGVIDMVNHLIWLIGQIPGIPSVGGGGGAAAGAGIGINAAAAPARGNRLGGGGVTVNFYGPVYGLDDFRRQVTQAVTDSYRRGGLGFLTP